MDREHRSGTVSLGPSVEGERDSGPVSAPRRSRDAPAPAPSPMARHCVPVYGTGGFTRLAFARRRQNCTFLQASTHRSVAKGPEDGGLGLSRHLTSFFWLLFDFIL